jgi:radical SAM protein with 4Fe4S-binding SPASM domain
LLLDADGAIYPCLNLHAPEFRIGSLRDAGFNFDEAWRTSPILDRVRRATWVEHPANACSECAVRAWCLGGCHGESWSLCQELNSRAWDCPNQPQAILDMIWLLSGARVDVPDGKRLC